MSCFLKKGDGDPPGPYSPSLPRALRARHGGTGEAVT